MKTATVVYLLLDTRDLSEPQILAVVPTREAAQQRLQAERRPAVLFQAEDHGDYFAALRPVAVRALRDGQPPGEGPLPSSQLAGLTMKALTWEVP